MGSTRDPARRNGGGASRLGGVRDRDAGALFVRLRSGGDQAARDQLVARFLPLARTIALRYRGHREPMDDLFQVATYGLIKA